MAIEIDNQARDRRVSARDLKRAASFICETVGYAKAELSIVLTDDEQIHALNKRWRGKDKPTDVLSFPQDRFEVTRVLGDVVISLETAARQAPRFHNDFAAEVDRLLVHGILHLVGHDHVHGGPQARKMKAEEERVLRSLVKARKSW
ncbi:MAG: rRNA maturation RNase YbeY [Clostridia bacterium]|nr:rRNA maturation RNase YbeY [Deltaproteobacteria bacterium]